MKALKKLAQRLHEMLPANRRVYFLYTHKNGFDRFNNGLKANTEISYWVYKALRAHFPRVRFLLFQNEKPGRIEQIRPQDVVVGHVGETFIEASQYTNRLIAFNPWSGDEDRSREGFNCTPMEKETALYDKAASLILLTSEFNKREYIDQPRNAWFSYFQKRKRVRIVHQPLDLTLFRRIKWEYTTDNFLYIGNKAHMKRVEEASALVKEVGRTLYLYGAEGNELDHLNKEQVNRLPAQADFFIQPGLWEAQCVSILEASARGFIPLVTEETGYPYSHPFLLRKRDFAHNLKVLKNVLNTSPKQRRDLADTLHSQLIEDSKHNDWKQLTDVVVEEVAFVLSQPVEV